MYYFICTEFLGLLQNPRRPCRFLTNCQADIIYHQKQFYRKFEKAFALRKNKYNCTCLQMPFDTLLA